MAPPAPRGGEPPLGRSGEIGEHRPVQVAHDRAHRHGHLDIAAPRPPPSLAAPVPTVAGATVGMVAKGEQRGLVGRGHEPHVPPVAPVATVGTPLAHVSLSAEGDGTRATVAGTGVELRLVDESRHDKGC